jgi:hypothetical protein
MISGTQKPQTAINTLAKFRFIFLLYKKGTRAELPSYFIIREMVTIAALLVLYNKERCLAVIADIQVNS